MSTRSDSSSPVSEQFRVLGPAPSFFLTNPLLTWDVFRSSEVPGGLDYYKNLFGVLSATQWSELAPSDNLIDNPGEGRHCLAKEGAEYLVYLGSAGSASLNIKQVQGTVKGNWKNLISGQEQAIGGW